MKIKLSKSQWEEMGKKAGWIKSAQSTSAIITLDAGLTRRLPVTMGGSTLDLDEVCNTLNDYKTNMTKIEGLRKTLNEMADGGITIIIDGLGYISVDINSPTQETKEDLEFGKWR